MSKATKKSVSCTPTGIGQWCGWELDYCSSTAVDLSHTCTPHPPYTEHMKDHLSHSPWCFKCIMKLMTDRSNWNTHRFVFYERRIRMTAVHEAVCWWDDGGNLKSTHSQNSLLPYRKYTYWLWCRESVKMADFHGLMVNIKLHPAGS